MGWVNIESVRLVCPDLGDVFERREAFQGLQTACVIVCCDEVCDVRFKFRIAQSSNKKPARYAANLQTTQTPDSVIAPETQRRI